MKLTRITCGRLARKGSPSLSGHSRGEKSPPKNDGLRRITPRAQHPGHPFVQPVVGLHVRVA
jgi:hypothetical protein